MRFLRVRLEAPEDRITSLAAFYRRLGFDVAAPCSFAVGETTLEFVAVGDEAFYHVALLLPGNRFEPALEWARSRTELLPDASGEVVFDFADWNACAFYFHDPAGNIVELIGHQRVGESEGSGDFRAAELVGLSELGLVGDVAGMAAALRSQLALEVWDGTVDVPGRLAFVGARARTLILSPPGRGWLPTGRPAAAFSVEALLGGPAAGAVELESRYRISAVAA